MKSFLLIFLAAILAPLHAAPWFDGADLSALDRIEGIGGTFRDDKGHAATAMPLLRPHRGVPNPPTLMESGETKKDRQNGEDWKNAPISKEYRRRSFCKVADAVKNRRQR